MSQNIGLKLTRDTDGFIPYVPFTLMPGQVSAFDLILSLDPTTLTNDASAVISAVNVVQDQATIATAAGITYPELINTDMRFAEWDHVNALTYITINASVTGKTGFTGGTHTNIISVSSFSPWTSGNGLSGESTEFESIEYTSSPMICSFSIVFSTANVPPSGIIGFTADISGSQAVGLTWDAVTVDGISAIGIVYKMNAIPSAANDGTIMYVNSGVSSKYISGLTDGSMYGFGIYTIDTGYETSIMATTSASPVWITTGGRVWTSHAEFRRMRLLGYI
jgi:hypothetical protein